MLRMDFNTKNDIVDDIQKFARQITIKDQTTLELMIKSRKLRNYLNVIKTDNFDLFTFILRRQLKFDRDYIKYYDIIIELKFLFTNPI